MMNGNSRPVAVIGAGGHAKVVMSVLRATGYEVSAVYDDSPEKRGKELFGVPILGPIEELEDSPKTHALIAIGDCRMRERVAHRFQHVTWVTAVHPSSYVDPTARLGPGTVVFAGAVVQPDAVIGAHVVINTGATVDHDCWVEDFAHLAPGVHLAGGVRIGRGAFLGVGAIVIPNRAVGRGAVVGAGGVVTADLPAGVTATGVPARAWNSFVARGDRLCPPVAGEKLGETP